MVVYVTVTVEAVPVGVGADMVEMIRSGQILMVGVLVLLVSLVAVMLVFASALAMRYQVPGAVPEGMVTEVEPELVAVEARAGTDRKSVVKGKGAGVEGEES